MDMNNIKILEELIQKVESLRRGKSPVDLDEILSGLNKLSASIVALQLELDNKTFFLNHIRGED